MLRAAPPHVRRNLDVSRTIPPDRQDKNIGADWRAIPVRLRDLTDDAKFWIENKTYALDEAAARFHHRLVSIHAFANGNGRHARLMADAVLRANGYEREFVYVYGAVSPMEGELDWMIGRQMNTERMGAFLAQVSAAHPRDFMLIIVDGASSHMAKELNIPENIRLLRLPPYAPELNPQEHVWDEIREKEFPNRVFADLGSVMRQLEDGLPRLAANTQGLRSLTAWPWIISLNLNATYNESRCFGLRDQATSAPDTHPLPARVVCRP